jgi:hypothetical protein
MLRKIKLMGLEQYINNTLSIDILFILSFGESHSRSIKRISANKLL